MSLVPTIRSKRTHSHFNFMMEWRWLSPPKIKSKLSSKNSNLYRAGTRLKLTQLQIELWAGSKIVQIEFIPNIGLVCLLDRTRIYIWLVLTPT